jgi:hypothetical protein
VELAAQVERHLPKLVLELSRKILHAELAHADVAAQTVIRGIADRLGGCDRPVPSTRGGAPTGAPRPPSRASASRPIPISARATGCSRSATGSSTGAWSRSSTRRGSS